MTVVIEINNSTSQIKGLTTGPFNALRKALSYQADSAGVYFSGAGYNRLKYCIDLKGVFATGLLYRVETFLKDSKIEYRRLDTRVVPTRFVNHKPTWGKITPHGWQTNATDVLAQKHRGIISAVTGSGKSLVIALIASRLNVRTLIVVPSLQIKEQLTDTFKSIFRDMRNITIENIDSKALKKASDYDCLIIDECHHSASKTYRKLNTTVWKGIYYRAFLSASPFRNQDEETMLFEGVAGKIIYKLSYHEAVKQKFIVPIEAYYIEIPKTPNDIDSWPEAYSKLVVNNTTRNEIIADWLLQLEAKGISTLCLVKEIKHGNNIAELTDLPFANGQDETTRTHIDDFNTGKIKVLIGTEGILGEGVDSKPCQFVIVAGLGKAKSALMQKIGRCLRMYPGKESGKVILIKDKSQKYLLRHFNTQCKVIEGEYGIKPTRIEI